MDDIEKLYTPSQWCSHRCKPEKVVEEHMKAVTEESLKITMEIPFVENLRYGNKPKQCLDLFEPVDVSDDTSTFIFIHGGYWQELSKEISRYCVKPLIQSNIRVIIPGYDLVPEVTLKTILQEIQDLRKFINELAQERHWKNIWYGGHSAGAHLAISLLCCETSLQPNPTGFILISGIYDLEPIIQTSINKTLKIARENYQSLSPLFQIPKIIDKNLHVLIIVAEHDSPAFHAQSKTFKQKMETLNSNVMLRVIDGADHFTIVENLKNRDFALTKLIINTITQISLKE